MSGSTLDEQPYFQKALGQYSLAYQIVFPMPRTAALRAASAAFDGGAASLLWAASSSVKDAIERQSSASYL